MMHYSSGNYIANIFFYLPNAILPLLVINVLGAETNAYFYVAWAIPGLLLVVPLATSTSLLAEGSYFPEELRKNVIKAFKFIFILLIPSIIGLLSLGDICCFCLARSMQKIHLKFC
jgi:O-antigen/teichoic acid export membrane protein